MANDQEKALFAAIGPLPGVYALADYIETRIAVGIHSANLAVVGGIQIGSAGATGSEYAGYTLAWGDDFNDSTPQIISPLTPGAKYLDMMTYTQNDATYAPRTKNGLLNYDPGLLETGANDINRGVPVASWQDIKSQSNGILTQLARHTQLIESLESGNSQSTLGSIISSCGVICGRPPFFFEAKLRINPNNTASTANFHPSFWGLLMGPVSTGVNLEVDWESDNTNTFNPTGYTWTNSGAGGTVMSGAGVGANISPNLQDGNWHTLGIECTPTYANFWCDGILVNTITLDFTSAGARPRYWMASCHINGTSTTVWGAQSVNSTATWSNSSSTLTIIPNNTGISVGQAITSTSGSGLPPGSTVLTKVGTNQVTIAGTTTAAASTAVPINFSFPSRATAQVAALDLEYVRVWRQTSGVHRTPLVVQPDFTIPFGGSFSIPLPPAATVWGDGTVDETVEMIPFNLRAPGGNYANGMFKGVTFPTFVTYSGGVLAGTVTDQPGTMLFARTGTHPGDTCAVQRFRGLVGPRIMTPPTINMVTGAAFAYDLYYDMDVGDLLPLTMSVTGLPTGLTIIPSGSSKGKISGTPTGTGTAVVTVTNAVGQQATASIVMAPDTPGTGTPLPASIFPNFANLAAAGLVASLDFDNTSSITIATGISSIAGADGTSYAAVQATGAAQPTFITDTTYNRKCARFTAASSQYLDWSSMVGAVDWTKPVSMIVVGKLVTTGTTYGFLDACLSSASTTADRAALMASSSAFIFRYGGSATNDATDAATTDTVCHTLVGRAVIFNSAQQFFNKDKTHSNYVGSATTAGSGGALDRVTVGARYAASAYSGFLDGEIFRVLVFNRFLEDYEINGICAWTTAKFGSL